MLEAYILCPVVTITYCYVRTKNRIAPKDAWRHVWKEEEDRRPEKWRLSDLQRTPRDTFWKWRYRTSHAGKRNYISFGNILGILEVI